MKRPEQEGETPHADRFTVHIWQARSGQWRTAIIEIAIDRLSKQTLYPRTAASRRDFSEGSCRMRSRRPEFGIARAFPLNSTLSWIPAATAAEPPAGGSSRDLYQNIGRHKLDAAAANVTAVPRFSSSTPGNRSE